MSEQPRAARTWTLHPGDAYFHLGSCDGDIRRYGEAVTVVEVSEQRKVRLHRHRANEGYDYNPWASCYGHGSENWAPIVSPTTPIFVANPQPNAPEKDVDECWEHADALLIGEGKL